MRGGKAALAVGIFVFAGLFLLFYLAMNVDDEGRLFRPDVDMSEYHAFFSSADGIRVEDPIYVAGVKAGRIVSIDVQNDDTARVKVVFTVEEGFPIYENSPVEIAQSNFLGGKRLNIQLPEDPGERLEDGQLARVIESDFVASINRAFTQVADLIEKNDEDVRAIVSNLRETTDGLNQTGTVLGNLINDEQMGTELRETFTRLSTIGENLDVVTTDIRTSLDENQGLLAQLIKDPQTRERFDTIVKNVEGASDSLQSVAAKVNDPESPGTLSRLINSEELGETISSAATNVNETFVDARDAADDLSAITERVRSGPGTLHSIIAEEEIANRLNLLLGNATAAIEDVREQAPITSFGTALLGGLQ